MAAWTTTFGRVLRWSGSRTTPVNGERLAQRTQVHAAYDEHYLYFAFRCLDPEPAKVRGSLSRRDDLWNDDWVGLSLDSLGNGQSSYDGS
jgi:hypothetical protein